MQHQRHAHRFEGAAGQFGRTAVAEAGSDLPVTCEKLTPPRSKTLPSSIKREVQPPPSGRTQESVRKGWPSKASSSPTMRDCRPVK
jgi:hypothetical protein